MLSAKAPGLNNKHLISSDKQYEGLNDANKAEMTNEKSLSFIFYWTRIILVNPLKPKSLKYFTYLIAKYINALF